MPEESNKKDKQFQINSEEREKLLLVYVNPEAEEDAYAEAELEGLVDAAGGEPVGQIRQRIERPYKAAYIGSGKVGEVAAMAAELGADAVVFDCELSGIHIKNLEEQIKLRVLDRTQLILDIFANRARTREGMLQVELAQYTYRLPRLMSVYTKFERQRGGIGMRGPGETKLESDRRMVRDRIARLKREIDVVKQHRTLQREGRRDQPYPVVAIVGYTSAGKSTLMNRLAQTDLLADAMPFATLDPTTRLVDLPDGYRFFLSDTVGFIRNLPTLLVAAFRATLEELLYADLLMHVVDVSNPEWEMQVEAVLQTVSGIGGDDIPVLTVFNKIDAAEDPQGVRRLALEHPDAVAISALTGEGIQDLLAMVRRLVSDRLSIVKVLVPYSETNLVERAYDFGRVLKKEYRDDGIYLEAEVVAEHRGKLEAYAVKER
ncbi:MAG: GTPase HflX [Armatimonadetes bacterium]|nr:GTPase HflX [Armatimonadota bacterium]MBS1710879.1 GTPase HflX [Armatimonadota bacterium]MBX3108551.1 GTPase HflX [Fimbriimonadaceae bacterium]